MTSRRHAVRVLLAVPLAGCGYHLQGRGALPPGVKRMGVVLEDATAKPTLGQMVTEKVVEELLKRGNLDVVTTAEGVDALVEGTLMRYDARPAGFSTDGSTTAASRYTVELSAKVRYTRTGQKEPLWSSEAFTAREEYELPTSTDNFFDREDQAIERLAVTFARNLVASMLEAF